MGRKGIFPKHGDPQALQQAIQDGLARLAFGPVNDAVKLLFMEDANPQALRGLNLYNVSEIRRSKNGVEICFFDRIAAMERLQQLGQGEGGLERLLQALAPGEAPEEEPEEEEEEEPAEAWTAEGRAAEARTMKKGQEAEAWGAETWTAEGRAVERQAPGLCWGEEPAEAWGDSLGGAGGPGEAAHG